MEMMRNHDCQDCRVEKLATVEEPFHFVDSGLPNVYLIGIGANPRRDGIW